MMLFADFLQCRIHVFAVAAFLFADVLGTSTADAQHPGFAKDPVIVEYDPVPDWPKYPENISSKGWTSGIALDSKENVWFFKKGDNPVQVYTTDGAFVRSWGEGMFDNPHHIRIDQNDYVWVADFGLHVVQKYSPEGDLLMTLGTKGESGEDETHFFRPTDMVVTPAGDIFVTDGYGNRRIVHFDSTGRYVKAWGNYGSGPGMFVLPHAIDVDSQGRLYVADRNSGRIQIFDQSGKYLDQWSNLIMPWGLSINDKDQIWVCGSSPHWWKRHDEYPEYKDQIFMRFDPDGRVQQVWSIPLGDIGDDKNNPVTSGLKPGEAVGVHCIVEDSAGNLYVGDIYGERAQKFVPVTSRPTKASE
jgi:DNA-binding beta-propeller fold protein YncE